MSSPASAHLDGPSLCQPFGEVKTVRVVSSASDIPKFATVEKSNSVFHVHPTYALPVPIHAMPYVASPSHIPPQLPYPSKALTGSRE